MTAPDICPLGIDGILVRFSTALSEEANQTAIAFRQRVAEADIPGVTDIVPSLTTVRVGFDPSKTTRADVTAALKQVIHMPVSIDASPRRRWHIPVAFGPRHAPQLYQAAELAGVSVETAVAEITARNLRVIALGFAPGQPYLGMLPPHWDIPRQSELTPHLPSGALVVAVRQLIIFAADAPTGWRHIGQTAFQVYRPQAPEPFAFEPGDEVRFAQVGDSELDVLSNRTDTNGGARCEVLG
ncbi:5-oxoprolinase subunit B family protein [Loktanella sp. S4079]|uniref:5-oxoprolinase subunit B family protein n=1 Tax=Loktanella sp. S4079 TaxID=579483 RepID=UPI00061EF39D|nr:carboxyltransferase domain-containing protein [Loktanella sp. S4079]KJZ17965.1 allophanate hydrolase [Loktanella sp. S4079]